MHSHKSLKTVHIT